MKTRLNALDIELHVTMTEKEARTLNWIAGYIRSPGFTEHFSKTPPRGVQVEDIDGVMIHLHSHMGRVLDALDSGRATIAESLKGIGK